MDKKTKYWFLLALSRAPRRGMGRGVLFEERPDFLEINFEEFEKKLELLKSEGLVENNPRDFFHFYLTDKGQKEVKSFYKPGKIREFYDLLRYFPELELRDRIENVEVLLFSLIITSISFYLMTKATGYASLALFTIFFTFLIATASYFSIVTFLVVERFAFLSKNKILEWFNIHRYYLSYYLLVIFTIIAVITLHYYFEWTYKQLGASLIVEITIVGWTDREQIQNLIQKLLLKKQLL